MAAERSDKCPYRSKYSPEECWISPQQWLVEYVCERQANQKKVALPLKFWEAPQWKLEFKKQLLFANTLLKLYSLKAIGQALRRKEAKNIYSLKAPWLDAIIKEEQEKLEKLEKVFQEVAVEEPEVVIDNEKPRKAFTTSTSIAAKLKDL